MAKKESLDELIKRALELSTDNVQISPDILGRLKSSLAAPEKIIFRKPSNGWNVRKKLGLALGVILMISVICCTLSKDTRAMAATALKMVKAIFVLENEGKGYRVVKQQVEKVNLFHSVCETTQLTDIEIAEKVGYKVSFPKSLAYGYTLKDKALRVSLNKMVNYNTAEALNQRLSRAIEDDREFRKLSAFKPHREISGTYKNRQAATIFINISRSWPKEALSGKTVTIATGKIEANWMESPFPVYPIKKENGIKSADMTKKPADIIITHSLYWEYGGLGYYLCSFYTNDLTLDEAVKIAESFIKNSNTKLETNIE
jgi:hypothetical protein